MGFIKKSTLAAALFALIVPFQANAADYTMKISHAGPVTDNSDDHYGSLMIKEYVEKHSDGKIKVEIYPGSQLGNYKSVIEQVEGGALEVAHTSIGGITPFIPALAVIDLPYFLPSDAIARELMKGQFVEEMRTGVQKKLKNVYLGSMCNGGNWRSFYTTKKEVKSAADLKGLKIRTINSPLQQTFVQEMGANPSAVAWGEVYTSLATGVVDGLKIAIADILTNKMDEHLNYGMLDQHTYLYGFYFVAQNWLDSLPADLQKVVKDGLIYGAEKQSDFNEQAEMSGREKFIAGGGKLYIPTAEEKAENSNVKGKMQEWYLKRYGKEGEYWLNTYSTAIDQAASK